MTLVLLSMVATAHTTASVHSLQQAERERSIASQGLVSAIEELRQTSNGLIGAVPSWSEALVDACAEGGDLGNEFQIPGLDRVEGEDAVCTLQLITSESLSDEDVGFEFGMPLDLNNDGDTSDGDVIGSAQMLPVVVRARWRGRMGERELTQGILLLGF